MNQEQYLNITSNFNFTSKNNFDNEDAEINQLLQSLDGYMDVLGKQDIFLAYFHTKLFIQENSFKKTLSL